MIHRSSHGKKWDEESILIKGYVFVYVPENYDFRYIKSDNNPFKTLKKMQNMENYMEKIISIADGYYIKMA